MYIYCIFLQVNFSICSVKDSTFGDFTLVVRWHEGYLACKNQCWCAGDGGLSGFRGRWFAHFSYLSLVMSSTSSYLLLQSIPEWFNIMVLACVARWHSGKVPDLRSVGRGFESQPPRCQGQPWASCASVTKQYNLVSANGQWCLASGKVTVGLASHWPRVRH